MNEIIQQFAKHICSNCISKHCEKGITFIQGKENSIRCVDYEKGKLKGYDKPIERTAKQIKPLMRFTQNY